MCHLAYMLNKLYLLQHSPSCCNVIRHFVFANSNLQPSILEAVCCCVLFQTVLSCLDELSVMYAKVVCCYFEFDIHSLSNIFLNEPFSLPPVYTPSPSTPSPPLSRCRIRQSSSPEKSRTCRINSQKR